MYCLSRFDVLGETRHGLSSPVGYFQMVRWGVAVLLSLVLVRVATPDARADQGEETTTDIPEITVVATRLKTPVKKVGSSVTVLTKEEIQASGKTTVAEVLRTVPGVDVVRSGGPGGNSAVFLRGANSEHTLILVDGLEANDPINPTRSFNFADLSLDNVERIEVLRGPQSTLYGSDALGGVIAIYTTRGSGEPLTTLSVEGGAYQSFREEVSHQSETESTAISVTASREDSASISAADARDGNSEHDRYGKTSASLRVDTEATEALSLSLTGRFTDSESDLDASGGVGGDDPNRKLRNQQLFSRVAGDVSLFGGALKQTYGIGYTWQETEDNNDPDAESAEYLRSRFEGTLLKFDLQNSIVTEGPLGFIVGLETEEEQGESRYRSDGLFGPYEDNLSSVDSRTSGYYVQTTVDIPDRFFLAAGLRLDDHSKFGAETTWRIAPALQLPETGSKLSGSIGTGFKAPSLFQLYSSFGNQDLEPEESRGWDVSVEQTLGEAGATIQVTYFSNDFDNLISFDPETFRSININEAKTSGVEFSSHLPLSEEASINLQYTYTDTEDKATGLTLLRRARNKMSGAVSYAVSDELDVTTTLSYVGPRSDNDFSTYPASRTTLGGYVTLGSTLRYRVATWIECFLRAENILDREYQEVLGYGTPGAGVYAGVKLLL